MAEKGKSIFDIFREKKKELEGALGATDAPVVTPKAKGLPVTVTPAPKPAQPSKPRGVPPSTYQDYLSNGGIWTEEEWKKNRKR
jgi:hypothetical protein